MLAACGTSASTLEEGDMPEAFPNHSKDNIINAIHLSADTLQAFEGEARLELNSPMQNGRFRSTIRQQRGDSLWMNVRATLGIEAARMLVTPDSFFVYNRIDNELASGSVQGAQRVFPVPVSGDELFTNLLGVVAPNDAVDWTLTHDDEMYYFESPDQRYMYAVDPALWRVVRFVERDADGTILDERVFSDHTTVDGVVVPNRIMLRRPPDDVRAVFTYRSLTLTPDSLSFSLDASSDAERVTLP